jgi:group I intron endonuclease
MIVIYKLSNKSNDRFYIGSSKNYESRITNHLYKLTYKKHENQFLQNDFNKCGIENFYFSILEELTTIDKLLEREQFYIDKHFDNQKKCYNINPIAKNPPITIKIGKHNPMYGRIGILHHNFGKPKTPETRQKLSTANLGKKHSELFKILRSKKYKGSGNPMFNRQHSEETKLKISLSLSGEKHPNFGKHLPIETKDKIRLKNKGKIRSIECRNKISNFSKTRTGTKNPFFGKKHSLETKLKISNARKKPIYSINLLNGIKVLHVSILEASIACKVSKTTIQCILNKKRKKTKNGYYFEYTDTVNVNSALVKEMLNDK